MLRTPPWPAGSVSALLRAPGPERRPAPASSRLALFGQREPQQSSRAQPGSRCPSNLPGCAEASRVVSRESGRRLWQGWGQPS